VNTPVTAAAGRSYRLEDRYELTDGEVHLSGLCPFNLGCDCAVRRAACG
jgi:hypothetical protein